MVYKEVISIMAGKGREVGKERNGEEKVRVFDVRSLGMG